MRQSDWHVALRSQSHRDSWIVLIIIPRGQEEESSSMCVQSNFKCLHFSVPSLFPCYLSLSVPSDKMFLLSTLL